MSHHIHTTTTLGTATSFLLVLLINQHTINHHTLTTFQLDTNTHLSMFVTMDTHDLPSSLLLTVHIIPASHHTSTLELKCNNQVIKVTFVALKLCFHTKFWGKHRNTLCTGLWWCLSIESEYTKLCFPCLGV